MGGDRAAAASANSRPAPAPSGAPPAAARAAAAALTGPLKEAESHPLVKELLKRFQADIIRREPLDHAAWLAKLRRESEPNRDG